MLVFGNEYVFSRVKKTMEVVVGLGVGAGEAEGLVIVRISALACETRHFFWVWVTDHNHIIIYCSEPTCILSQKKFWRI